MNELEPGLSYAGIASRVIGGDYLLEERDPDSPYFGFVNFMRIMVAAPPDWNGGEEVNEALKRKVFSAEDAGYFDLETVQGQLDHQICLNDEPGRYSVFGSFGQLAYIRQKGVDLGFFRDSLEFEYE